MKNAGTGQKHVAEASIDSEAAFIKFGNPKSTAQIEQDSVQEYLTFLREQGRSNRTLEKHLACLQLFLSG